MDINENEANLKEIEVNEELFEEQILMALKESRKTYNQEFSKIWSKLYLNIWEFVIFIRLVKLILCLIDIDADQSQSQDNTNQEIAKTEHTMSTGAGVNLSQALSQFSDDQGVTESVELTRSQMKMKDLKQFVRNTDFESSEAISLVMEKFVDQPKVYDENAIKQRLIYAKGVLNVLKVRIKRNLNFWNLRIRVWFVKTFRGFELY
jgi:hypothetical protein